MRALVIPVRSDWYGVDMTAGGDRSPASWLLEIERIHQVIGDGPIW